MGPRPPDFDEALVKKSPTFKKWTELEAGASMKYACRTFIKGHGDDEERLLRRIMIARRNNLRDHAVLKQARRTVPKKTTQTSLSDTQVEREMDVASVEKTRSYQAWLKLPDGAPFIYNQKYIKGNREHDWLLRKNIWRRMRYRRENKKMVAQHHQNVSSSHFLHPEAIQAAVAVAETFQSVADPPHAPNNNNDHTSHSETVTTTPDTNHHHHTMQEDALESAALESAAKIALMAGVDDIKPESLDLDDEGSGILHV